MTIEEQTETLGFQTEAKQLLHLVTHSLYSNKEIFLRELISNSSDATDKLRFEALSDSALYENDSELKIRIDFDKKDQTITIEDNGIGMSREEVIDNLGTIAKSGTRAFLESLTESQAKNSSLIGQFGVGFYSAFIVSKKVEVESRRAGMDKNQGIFWSSNGEGKYTIKNIEKEKRGTKITLHLRPEESEFLDEWRLKSIITKYSDHILLPIVMKKTVEKSDKDDDQKKQSEEKQDQTEEVVNKAKALWTLPKKEIKDEEYKELYKHISHDFSDPLVWAHNRIEGKLEYISLLYIPSTQPFDLWNYENKHGLKLYVRRIFVMDDAKQLLPLYLRFVRGIIDSNDLPLNVSREILQNNNTIESIKSGIVKRILDMLQNLTEKDPEKYSKFWKTFGNVIKEGLGEDFSNKEKISQLLRFSTTHNDTEEQTESLDNYISRMQKSQDEIYYEIADTHTAAKNSPHLEIFKKKNIEVLLLSDRIDEWLVDNLHEYKGKKLKSVAKGDLDLEKIEGKKGKAKEEKTKKEYSSTLDQMKDILKDKIQDIRLTDRLTDSPTCLVVNESDMSPHLQRIMQAAGQNITKNKPILEVNPDHLLIKQLQSEKDKTKFEQWTNILFEEALLAEGGKLENPASFVKRLNDLFLQNG